MRGGGFRNLRAGRHPFTGAGVDENTAAVLVQSPNFFGVVEDIAAVEPVVHAKGALLVSGFTEATSLGILKPAGASGADFVVGEGQGFGNPVNYGGPYLGIFASTDRFLRKIPGRLVGRRWTGKAAGGSS